ncbi:jg15611 [Pararge aegeria aegeria]|uniref:Jg15611 protein n=1 Tax=Pararge aegeria aegeria TaxID=348720 RepID=A0A8S4RU39_9NEOP|nr:jg15611 [Pararge aegeria aegeria]
MLCEKPLPINSTTSQGKQGARPVTRRPASINLRRKLHVPVIILAWAWSPFNRNSIATMLLSGRNKHGDITSPDELSHKKHYNNQALQTGTQRFNNFNQHY